MCWACLLQILALGFFLSLCSRVVQAARFLAGLVCCKAGGGAVCFRFVGGAIGLEFCQVEQS